MSWKGFTDWWLDEISNDPAYEQVVTPLLLDLLAPQRGLTYLDIGCGEGRVSRAVEAWGAGCFGVEVNEFLASSSGSRTLVARAELLPVRGEAFDGVFLVLVIEHIEEYVGVLVEAARITKPGGVLALVMNHPIWTAPGSTPITDEDGEVLWRPGEYFSDGFDEMRVGEETVVFHHRRMASLLNAAADSGWYLEEMVEAPHHQFVDQAGIPRLLACRWRLPAS